MIKLYPLALILLTVTLSGCVLKYDEPEASINQTPVSTASTTQISEPSTVYVDIRGSAFTPLELNVVKGTTVEWRNYDSGQYVIFVDNVSSPPFDKRESWSYRFNETGTFEYNSSKHPWMKHGRITVENPGDLN